MLEKIRLESASALGSPLRAGLPCIEVELPEELQRHSLSRCPLPRRCPENPGRVDCAYYDRGGEGVAYHDVDAKNNGSGVLNPATGPT